MDSLSLCLFSGGFVGAVGGYFVYRRKGRTPWRGALWFGFLGFITFSAWIIILPLGFLWVLSRPNWVAGMPMRKYAAQEVNTLAQAWKPLSQIAEDGVDDRDILQLDATRLLVPLGPRFLVPRKTEKGKGTYEVRLDFPEICAWSLDTAVVGTRSVQVRKQVRLDHSTVGASAARLSGRFALALVLTSIGIQSTGGIEDELERDRQRFTATLQFELPASKNFSRGGGGIPVDLENVYTQHQAVLLNFRDSGYTQAIYDLNRGLEGDPGHASEHVQREPAGSAIAQATPEAAATDDSPGSKEFLFNATDWIAYTCYYNGMADKADRFYETLLTWSKDNPPPVDCILCRFDTGGSGYSHFVGCIASQAEVGLLSSWKGNDFFDYQQETGTYESGGDSGTASITQILTPERIAEMVQAGRLEKRAGKPDLSRFNRF